MAKKKPGVAKDTTFKIRCRSEDLERFRHASEEEGFGGAIAPWLLYHARNQAKQHKEGKSMESLHKQASRVRLQLAKEEAERRREEDERRRAALYKPTETLPRRKKAEDESPA